MTRGCKVSPSFLVFRAEGNSMILRLKMKSGRIYQASATRRCRRFAHQLQFVEAIHGVASELTLGSYESGED